MVIYDVGKAFGLIILKRKKGSNFPQDTITTACPITTVSKSIEYATSLPPKRESFPHPSTPLQEFEKHIGTY